MGLVGELQPLLRQLGHNHQMFADRDYNGRTVTLTAAREGHVEVTRLLIEYGCSANTPNNDGWTPLHFACRGMRRRRLPRPRLSASPPLSPPAFLSLPLSVCRPHTAPASAAAPYGTYGRRPH